jgi:putative CRISPR-associated protein (TIGR02619 family)
MPRLLICTVGTSLLTNRDQRPWGGWPRQTPLPDPEAVDSWLAGADPVAASAETNTLHAVGLDQTDQVVLLHSDTPEGHFCSERLRAYLQAGRCRAAATRRLSALGYHSASFAQRGLKSLVAETAAGITQARRGGLEPVLCATGGFKAEIAFANLLGALLDVEVYYIHEQFREVVRLPRLPLAWDADFVNRHRDFFEWVDAEPRPSIAVENRLKGRPELRPLVEDGADGCTYLNAAGNLLFTAAREKLARGPAATWPEAVAMPPSEKDGLSGVEHHRPRGWERFVQRLCSIDCVRRVSYDATAHGGPAVKVLDAVAGDIGVRFGAAGQALPLRVQTTAKGHPQTELVADYLRHQLRLT